MSRRFHLLGRAVIIVDGKVLLAHAKGSTNTFLPGGHIEIGESIPDGIKREIQEELGLSAEMGLTSEQWNISGALARWKIPR